jgi:single-strand DNA-binding protein
MSHEQITLVGNIGSEISMRYTPSGVPVANFSLAINRTWNDANGNKQEKTSWRKIVCWRKQAELASQYLEKGRQIMVVGELEDPEQWTGKDGTSRVTMVVTAQKIVFLGGKPANTNGHEAPGAPVAAHTGADTIDGEEIPF